MSPKLLKTRLAALISTSEGMWVKQAGQECHFVGPFEWRQWSRLEAGAAALPLWAVLVPHSLCSHTCANKITPWCVISCIVTDMRSENKREYIREDTAYLILIIQTKNTHRAALACVAPRTLLQRPFGSLCSAPSHRRGG